MPGFVPGRYNCRWNMAMNHLEQLVQKGELWRGGQGGLQKHGLEPTGWQVLDDCIGGGWPRGSLVEILNQGHQGLSLLLPLLSRLDGDGRWLTWIAPPHLPYAPALATQGVPLQQVLLVQDVSAEQRLWAAEQALKSAACAVVMLWPERMDIAQLRRLQLAAGQGDCIAVLFRSLRDSAQSSPAALRLRVGSTPLGLEVEVLKRRAGWAGGCCEIATYPFSRKRQG